MNWKTVIASGIICVAFNLFADTPYLPYSANIELYEPQFEIKTKALNTPTIRFYIYQGTNVFDSTGYNAYLRWGKDTWASSMVTVTGVVGEAYTDFIATSNDLAYPITRWYCSLMLTKGDSVYSVSYGYMTVLPSPEVSSTAILQQTYAINGSEYGPFTGSFSGWPFALTNDITGNTNAIWGNITGTLSDQTDLTQTVEKASTAYGWGNWALNYSISDYGITDAYTKVESDAAYDALGAAGTVQTNLDTHEGLEGTNVHGLDTMSLQGTGDYYTATATDTLLTDKQDASTNLDSWAVIGPAEKQDAGDYATGTPIYVESDPVWLAEKGSYATGTPIYAESDPVWISEKSDYATGTPLYVETYLGTVTGGTITTGASASVTTNAGVLEFVVPSDYATGTPVYVETDPVWESEKAGYSTGTPIYVEVDPVWEAEKAGYATGTPVYAESDPIWVADKTGYYTMVESDDTFATTGTVGDISADVAIIKTNYFPLQSGLDSSNRVGLVEVEVDVLNTNTAPLQSFLSISNDFRIAETNYFPLQSGIGVSNRVGAVEGEVDILNTNTAPLQSFLGAWLGRDRGRRA